MPDKIASMKLPGRIKKASTKLINVEVGYENVPGGSEAYLSEDANDTGSGENDHEHDHGVVHTPVEKKSPGKFEYIGKSREDTSNSDSNYSRGKDGSSSSSSESNSDDESETGVEVENNVTSSSKSQKRDQPDTAEGVQSNKKPRAMKVDNGAVLSILPPFTFDFHSESFRDILIGKFPDDVSDSEITEFCNLYNTKQMPKDVLATYEPFFGALKIRTLGMESYSELFYLLENCKYTLL